MNREIKEAGEVLNRQIIFRGKIVDSIKKGQWEYGSLLINPEKEYLIWSEERELFVKVEPNTIGQFTGLKDKNGVDIYEGDVMLFSYLYEEYTDACFLYGVAPEHNTSIDILYLDEQKGVVEYNKDKFILKISDTSSHSLFQGDILFNKVLDRVSILNNNNIITFLDEDMKLGSNVANSFINNEFDREQILSDALDLIAKYEVQGSIHDNPELLTDK